MTLIILFLSLIICIRVNSTPNFVIILTDDQDTLLGSMLPMQRTIELISKKGATFTNAYINSPVCCPSRSTILTGKFLHTVQVRNNSVSGNCSSIEWQKNHEPYTIANILKTQRNYNTFYAGKYLNQYGMNETGGLRHVPPGYDWWLGLQGNSVYYNYTLSINGTAKYFQNDYLTDIIRDYALDFLNQAQLVDTPFFMMLCPPAAHAPFTPAPRHKGKFKGIKAPRTPSFNFSSSDKHWIVTKSPNHLPTNVSSLDYIYQSRLETLLAVDEMVDDIFTKLKKMDILNKTYLIFTSDHGFHIGQFTQPWDKRQPYETDTKVPLLIRGPGIVKVVLDEPVSIVDLAPTILDLSNVEVPADIDGKSLVNKLKGKKKFSYKDNFIYFEYHGEGGDENTNNSDCPNTEELLQCTQSNWCKCQDSRNNTYTCVKYAIENINFKYCRFYDDSNFREAYDLIKDPYELINIYGRLSNDTIKYFEQVIDNYLRT